MPAFYKPERGVVTTSRKKPKPESWSTKKDKGLKKKTAGVAPLWGKGKKLIPDEDRKEMIDRVKGLKKKKPLSIRQAVKDVVAEGGSPKLTTDEARMSRIDKKLGIIPKDDHPIKDKNFKKGGRAGKQFGGRTNLLEELGRVEGEPSNRNRRAEISRVHGELNRGYKHGKRVGLKGGGSAGPVVSGKKVGIQIK